MDRDEAPVPRERDAHVEGADGVHVRDDDGHARQRPAAVLELELALERDLGPAPERRPLRPDEHILEVELHVLLDAQAARPVAVAREAGDGRERRPGAEAQHRDAGSSGGEELSLAALRLQQVLENLG